MPWFNVDDGAYDHPKILRLLSMRNGYKSFTLWALAGAWCMRHLTDGVVSDAIVKRLGFGSRDVRRLLEVGLWVRKDVGSDECFAFKNWLDYQRSADQVRLERSRNKEKKTKQRCRARSGVPPGVPPGTDPGYAPGPSPGESPVPNTNPIQTKPPRGGGPPDPPTIPGSSESLPWRRCFDLLAELTAGAVGDATGCRRDCQRVADYALQQSVNAGNGEWFETAERAIRAWHSGQLERNKPLRSDWLANDFPKHWQAITKPQEAESQATKVVREAELYIRLRGLGDGLTDEQRAEMRKLRPSYDKYERNGDWYEARAGGGR